MAENSRDDFQDLTAEQIATVYAKALYGAAQQAGELQAIYAELSSLVDDVLKPQAEFRRLLESTFVAHEEKERILDRVLGSQASEMLLSFLKVLSAHGRLSCLAGVRRKLHDLYNQAHGIVEVQISTATEIDEALKNELSASLEKLLGAKPEVHVTPDASLLGGVVVKVGDRVYDGSIATHLAQLRHQMIDRTVDEIETRREAFLQENTN